MTLPANSQPFTDRLPQEEVQAAANHLLEVLAKQRQGEAKLRAHPTDESGPVEIELHPMISDVLMEALRVLSAGKAVTLVPIDQQLTTQQAADLLNVSRPFLIKLLDRGELDHTLVGRHRRISAKDVFDYKDKRKKTRRKALSELARTDADIL